MNPPSRRGLLLWGAGAWAQSAAPEIRLICAAPSPYTKRRDPPSAPAPASCSVCAGSSRRTSSTSAPPTTTPPPGSLSPNACQRDRKAPSASCWSVPPSGRKGLPPSPVPSLKPSTWNRCPASWPPPGSPPAEPTRAGPRPFSPTWPPSCPRRLRLHLRPETGRLPDR